MQAVLAGATGCERRHLFVLSHPVRNVAPPREADAWMAWTAGTTKSEATEDFLQKQEVNPVGSWKTFVIVFLPCTGNHAVQTSMAETETNASKECRPRFLLLRTLAGLNI